MDILSRIIRMYSNAGQDSLKHIYLKQMDETLQEIISREPEARKNWTNFEIDCQLKYVFLFMEQGNFPVALEHMDKAKSITGQSCRYSVLAECSVSSVTVLYSYEGI